MAQPEFKRAMGGAPIWRCGQLEIRDVKKDGGDWARNGYDPVARYNLWAGSGADNICAVEVSNQLSELKKFALTHFDPETGKRL